MKHNVAQLKYFGCVTYAHVPYEMRNKLDNKGQKCIFYGYSEDTKAYKLQDPIARKFIMNCDFQFVENEAWDESIERMLKSIDTMGHDEIEDEVGQTPIINQSTIPSTPGTTQISTQTTPVRYAGAQSTPREKQTLANSLSSSTSPYPILAILLPRKTRSLCDIYNIDKTNSFSLFSLFSQTNDPLTFEEASKDGVWAQAMDGEIKNIQNNQT
jgi:hypothetical protein